MQMEKQVLTPYTLNNFLTVEEGPDHGTAKFDEKLIEVVDETGVVRKFEGRLLKKLLKSWGTSTSEYKGLLKRGALGLLKHERSTPKFLILNQFDQAVTVGDETSLDSLTSYLIRTYPSQMTDNGQFYVYHDRENILMYVEPWGTSLKMLRHDEGLKDVSTIVTLKTKKLLEQDRLEWEQAFTKFAEDKTYQPGLHRPMLGKINVTLAELFTFQQYMPPELNLELERAMGQSVDLTMRMPLKALQRVKVSVTAIEMLDFVDHDVHAMVFKKAEMLKYFAQGRNDESFQFKNLNLKVPAAA